VYIYSLPDAPGARTFGVGEVGEELLELSHCCGLGAMGGAWTSGPTATQRSSVHT